MELSFVTDNFRLMYVGIATFMWLVSLILSAEYMKHYERKGRFFFFTLFTYAATVGVFLAGDLYTMFIFFEAMSLASYVWVAFDEKEESLRAAGTYLAVSVIGGLVMLMGLFILYDVAKGVFRVPGHPLDITQIPNLYDTARLLADGTDRRIWAAGICMLVGFGAKAGAFPLHIWLPKAHPVAPAPASALLSGMLTKTGILGILMLSRYIFDPVFPYEAPWASMILIIGTATMLLGAVLAVFSVNLKRTLACSSVSQIGFILTGIGAADLGTGHLALSGSLLHMVGHSLFKLILFCAAGVVFMNIHKLDLDDIRGFGRKKPLLNVIFLSGALGIAGIPGFNGYISKTLIHEGIVELEDYLAYLENGGCMTLITHNAANVIEWIFLISGGCTLAYMLKLYICIFIEKNTDDEVQARYDEQRSYMNPLTAGALTVTALIPPALGLTASRSMNGIVNMCAEALNIRTSSEYILENYFSWECLKGGLISIAIGLVIYIGIIRICLMSDDKSRYLDVWPKWMDLENSLYRPVLLHAIPFVMTIFCRALDDLTDSIVYALRKSLFKDSKQQEELEEGTRITYALGVIAGRMARLRRRILKNRGRKVGKPVNYVHKYAMDYESYKVSRTLIFRSMSFGLMLFCLGLVLTVVYIFVTRLW